MKTTFCLLALAGLSLVGCSKENPPTPSAPAATTNKSAAFENPLNAPADYGKALVNAQKNATKTVDLASLTKAIDMFQVDKGRFPKDLQELVAGKYIGQIPPAPAGMRIVYDPNTGTVKAVNQ
jgi:hypothetical protein